MEFLTRFRCTEMRDAAEVGNCGAWPRSVLVVWRVESDTHPSSTTLSTIEQALVDGADKQLRTRVSTAAHGAAILHLHPRPAVARRARRLRVVRRIRLHESAGQTDDET